MKNQLVALFLAVSGWCVVGEAHSFDSVGEYLELIRKEIPVVACSGSMSIANLNMNRQGNVIIARPGEKIYGMVNFSCDTASLDQYSLNQIIIGYEGLGPKGCIFNELGYRCGDGIKTIYLEAPREPGVYNIQCSLEQARSPSEAMQNWSSSESVKMTIGSIVVN